MKPSLHADLEIELDECFHTQQPRTARWLSPQGFSSPSSRLVTNFLSWDLCTCCHTRENVDAKGEDSLWAGAMFRSMNMCKGS